MSTPFRFGLWLPIGATAMLAWSLPAAAQNAPQQPAGNAQPLLPFERCIEVQIEGDRQFGCINQHLRRNVERVNPSTAVAPIDARSPDIQVGNVNQAAIRQQYGGNFGHSVIPFRPAPPNVPTPVRR